MPDRENEEKLKAITQKVADEGGKLYIVGGYVRDKLLNRENKDIDAEIFSLSPQKTEEILSSFGRIKKIGESFGIYTLCGWDIDFALPRRERAIGLGHKDFDIFVDPCLPEKEACRRRDFTINAMLLDPLSGEILDYFGGQKDIRERTVRHVDARTFSEDPLRALRACQFASRFRFSIAEETLCLCRTMDLSFLPKERIFSELQKALLKSESPSLFFRYLIKMEKTELFPELFRLRTVGQNPRYHSEGNVFEHTMRVVDCAARYREKASDPLGFMLSALCHDFGKYTTTKPDEKGVLHAIGHETEGKPLIQAFLQRLTNDKKRTAYVLNLCELHMLPNRLSQAPSKPRKTNEMFDRAIDPVALIYLAKANREGRICAEEEKDNTDFLTGRLSLYRETMKAPFVTGKDLIEAGFSPGIQIKEILAFAHKLRLQGQKKELVLKQIRSIYRPKSE